MDIKIEVNNKVIIAKKGETVLSALNRNGFKVPTLCNMKDFTPTGACRMCVVEVEGREKLVPSCSHLVEEWMKINTHSPRVLSARKTIIELLLADHPDDCLYCERNGTCELQKLAEDLHIRERKLAGKKKNLKIDKSSPGIIRDPSKCILCGRCVRVCEEKQTVAAFDFGYRGIKTKIATTFEKPLNYSNCIVCGQCVAVCPTGALTENVSLSELENMLQHPEKNFVVQYSPAIIPSLIEEFQLKTVRNPAGLLNATLRKLNFEAVIDTSLGADIVTEHIAGEIILRKNENNKLPVYSSCCPSWVLYAEQNHHDLIDQLAPVESPQIISGNILKSYINKEKKIDYNHIFTVSIMPCTAKKYECKRVELTEKGMPSVDMVITARELSRLIRMNGIDISNIEPETMNEPFDKSSGASKLISISGGTTEGLIRTLYYKLTKKEFEENKLSVLRGNKEVKEYQLTVGKDKYGFMVINGFQNIEKHLQEIKQRNDLHFVEVMACTGGCIGGGGQPRAVDIEIIKNRSKILYETDERELFRASYKSPGMKYIEENILKDVNGKVKKAMIRTSFKRKNVWDE